MGTFYEAFFPFLKPLGEIQLTLTTQSSISDDLILISKIIQAIAMALKSDGSDIPYIPYDELVKIQKSVNLIFNDENLKSLTHKIYDKISDIIDQRQANCLETINYFINLNSNIEFRKSHQPRPVIEPFSETEFKSFEQKPLSQVSGALCTKGYISSHILHGLLNNEALKLKRSIKNESSDEIAKLLQIRLMAVTNAKQGSPRIRHDAGEFKIPASVLLKWSHSPRSSPRRVPRLETSNFEPAFSSYRQRSQSLNHRPIPRHHGLKQRPTRKDAITTELRADFAGINLKKTNRPKIK